LYVDFDVETLALCTGFFPPSIPVDNLIPYVAAIPYFAKKRLRNPVIVSPSANGVNRAKKFRDYLTKAGVDASYVNQCISQTPFLLVYFSYMSTSPVSIS
jgi:hypothetical protein